MDGDSEREDTLWIEVEIEDWQVYPGMTFDFLHCRKILEKLIRSRYMTLRAGQKLACTNVDSDRYRIELAAVNVLGYYGRPRPDNVYDLSTVALQIHQWHAKGATDETEFIHDRIIEVQSIPNGDLCGTWTPLIFEDNVHFQLLVQLVNYIKLMRNPTTAGKAPGRVWNRTALIHGPCNVGKTTLCTALAQQLGIVFGGKILLRVDCKLLNSINPDHKAQNFDKVFSGIQKLAADDHRLVVVFFDGVECAALSRGHQIRQKGNHDGVKATTAFLSLLADLQGFNNVVVLCTTTNFKDLDADFVSRVDFKHKIVFPSAPTIYEFFRKTLNELHRSGYFSEEGPIEFQRKQACENPESVVQAEPIPRFDIMHALMCVGMRPAVLVKMPIICFTLFSEFKSITIEKAIAALGMNVKELSKEDGSVPRAGGKA